MPIFQSMPTVLLSVYFFVVGTVFASFASLIGDRVPDGVSMIRPRSYCPRCDHTLSFIELIPLVSWLWLGGKCSVCKVKVPIRYPVCEMALGVVLVLSIWTSSPTNMLMNFLLWFVLIIAVSTDVKFLLVPNWLTFTSAIVSACVTYLVSGHVILPSIGALTGFGILWFVHVVSGGKMGLGDAKLYVTIGVILGVGLCVESFVLACAYGAVIGGVMRITGHLKRMQPVPFVPFIALGVFTSQFILPHLWEGYLRYVLGLHV